MGIVVIPAIGLYLLISVGVVFWAIRHARKNGKSTKRWGWCAALVMYLIPFWDWIPTVAVHQYYCAKESGFWIYKTLDQWKTENPGVIETLVVNKKMAALRKGDMNNSVDTYELNQRFHWVVKRKGQLVLNRWRHEQELVDVKTDEILARYVGFSTSQERRQAGWSGWKFWLDSRYCSGGKLEESLMRQFKNRLRGTQE